MIPHAARIRFKDPETGLTLVFLSNRVTLAALTVCALHKSRCQVELFFEWIKQHLRSSDSMVRRRMQCRRRS
jgi:hypothetical protein